MWLVFDKIINSMIGLLKVALGIIPVFAIINYAMSPAFSGGGNNINSDFLAIKDNGGYRLAVFDVTGYSSSFDETDEDPWITAINTTPRWGIVASNDLPFGTKIMIPDLFGNQIFVVEDRMHHRFLKRIDIWFPSKQQALQFGFHPNVIIKILE